MPQTIKKAKNTQVSHNHGHVFLGTIVMMSRSLLLFLSQGKVFPRDNGEGEDKKKCIHKKRYTACVDGDKRVSI